MGKFAKEAIEEKAASVTQQEMKPETGQGQILEGFV